jgi:hypothetical protein
MVLSYAANSTIRPPIANGKGKRMQSIQEDIESLKEQLGKRSIQKAYKALISFMMGLRTFFANKYGDSAVSALYQGYMDMTYFAIFPPSLKSHDLKVAIVFNYDAFRFEAWLAARNRKVQRQYWELFKDSQWPGYRIVTPAGGIDSIIECDLAIDFDIGEPDSLTLKIESSIEAFIKNIERYLSEHQSEAAR